MADMNRPLRLGLRENWPQFSLLIVVNAFVGAMIGLERTILPLLAEQEFKLESQTIVLSFLISFGATKALANLFAGGLGDKIGRKTILIVGWLIGLPIPLLLIWAPTWGWVIFANVLLGVNQGFCWSTTVIMKIDLVGSRQRGLAMGINEFAGYLAVSVSALITGFLAASYGLRPIPFVPGFAFAGLGLLLSVFFVKDTRAHAALESAQQDAQSGVLTRPLSFREVFARTSWGDRSLFSVSQAGMINNLNDGVVWGLVPVVAAAAGLEIAQIAIVAAAYPAVWGIGQLFTGGLSDRWGRKWLIVVGLWIQAIGIGLFALASGFNIWLVAGVFMGLGTAMVYPTLLAAISDVAHPSWRSSSVGVYRLWRDGGFAIGGLTAGLLADAYGIPVAIAAVGVLTLASGVIVALVMNETLASKQ
jgi:MFS family permease